MDEKKNMIEKKKFTKDSRIEISYHKVGENFVSITWLKKCFFRTKNLIQ